MVLMLCIGLVFCCSCPPSVLPATGLFSLLPLKAKSFKIMVHADRLQSLSTILAEATSVRVSPVLLLRPLFSAHSTGGSI